MRLHHLPLAGLFLAWNTAVARPQTPDLQGVARNLVQSALIKSGDKVMVSGSVRDIGLLEDISIEAQKVGADPIITVSSDRLTRRSYDEVPAAFDSVTSPFSLALSKMTDAQIFVDVGESDSLLAKVPPERLAARSKAGQAVFDAFLKRAVRSVNLGNGVYPTARLAHRLNLSQPNVAGIFWRAARVPAAELRAKGQALEARAANAKRVTVTAPNGTNVAFGVLMDGEFLSDGALTEEKLKHGAGASITYLPAGELIIPAVPGTAEGKIVVDNVSIRGAKIRGLTLVFTGGRLTSMTATSGLAAVKQLYDAAGGGKDQLGYIDIGLNPQAKFPIGVGPVIWMAAGAVTLGVGNNQGMGGTNVSEFGLPVQLGHATVAADGNVLVENGLLK